MIDLIPTLEQLAGIHAPSGYEDPMIRAMRDEFARFGVETRVDPLGNVIAPVRAGQAGYPHVAIFAHMDEVALVVRKIDPNGFIRLQRMGGIPEKSMAGQHILFLAGDKTVPGIVGTKSHHVTEDSEKYQVVPIKSAYADIGACSRDEVRARGIDIGTPAVWHPHFQVMGDFVQTKAIDNRAACTILLALADRAPSIGGGAGLTLIASVQEEFNIRGVITAIRTIRPDLIFCLDITPAHDTPDTTHLGEVALGAGPSIGMFSLHGRGTLNGLIPNPRLVQFVQNIAVQSEIPQQRAVFMGGLTDASYAQLEGEGIPALDLALPCRYTHSPVETCSLNDMVAMVELLSKVMEKIPEGFSVARG